MASADRACLLKRKIIFCNYKRTDTSHAMREFQRQSVISGPSDFVVKTLSFNRWVSHRAGFEPGSVHICNKKSNSLLEYTYVHNIPHIKTPFKAYETL